MPGEIVERMLFSHPICLFNFADIIKLSIGKPQGIGYLADLKMSCWIWQSGNSSKLFKPGMNCSRGPGGIQNYEHFPGYICILSISSFHVLTNLGVTGYYDHAGIWLSADKYPIYHASTSLNARCTCLNSRMYCWVNLIHRWSSHCGHTQRASPVDWIF